MWEAGRRTQVIEPSFAAAWSTAEQETRIGSGAQTNPDTPRWEAGSYSTEVRASKYLWYCSFLHLWDNVKPYRVDVMRSREVDKSCDDVPATSGLRWSQEAMGSSMKSPAALLGARRLSSVPMLCLLTPVGLLVAVFSYQMTCGVAVPVFT